MLKDRDPVAPFLHMSELISGNGPFRREFGWTDAKVDALVADAEKLILSSANNAMCALACVVDVVAHRHLRQEGHPVSTPALICAEIGFGKLIEWYTEKHSVEMAHLFYDQNEPFIKSIRTRWLRHEEKMRRRLVTDDLVWGRIAIVQPVNMRTTPQVQACDVISWSYNRRLVAKPGDKWATLADRLLGTPRRPSKLENWQYKITEAVMRAKNPKPC